MKSEVRFSVLASGSKGNSCYFETDRTRILIDAGLSCRELMRRLEGIGIRPDTLDALIITHEHTDHIRGAGPLSRRFDLPVYINQKTFDAGVKALGKLPRPMIIQTGQSITINDITVETFTKCHDAADPFGLVFTSNGAKVGLVTDLGRSTRLLENCLAGCQALIIEFNYDQEMLDKGPYPLFLKRRINGSEGHLSNRQAGALLNAVSHEKLEQVVLAHLSETNNRPEMACREAAKALERSDIKDADISVKPGTLIALK